MDQVVIGGVVLKKEAREKATEVTISGKNGRFFRVRGKALGKATEYLEHVEEGKPYLFLGGFITRKDKEGKESFEIGVTRAVPLNHEVSENPQGKYLDGGLNKVTFMGRLGADAEVKYIPTEEGAVSLAIFRVAVRKDKDRTVWVGCKGWDLPEDTLDGLKKGAPVYVEGEYRLEKWDKDGVAHYRPAILVKKVLAGEGAPRKAKDSPEDLF